MYAMHALYAHDVDEYSITVLPRGLHGPKSGTVYNLTVIPVVWGSYYRNVICIARSVGVGGN